MLLKLPQKTQRKEFDFRKEEKDVYKEKIFHTARLAATVKQKNGID